MKKGHDCLLVGCTWLLATSVKAPCKAFLHYPWPLWPSSLHGYCVLPPRMLKVLEERSWRIWVMMIPIPTIHSLESASKKRMCDLSLYANVHSASTACKECIIIIIIIIQKLYRMKCLLCNNNVHSKHRSLTAWSLEYVCLASVKELTFWSD